MLYMECLCFVLDLALEFDNKIRIVLIIFNKKKKGKNYCYAYLIVTTVLL